MGVIRSMAQIFAFTSRIILISVISLILSRLNGVTIKSNFCSSPSSKSKSAFPYRSILLMNTMIGMLRIRQTSTNFSVCSSTPLATSTTTITLSTAVNVLKVSSAKSLCLGVSRIFIFFLNKFLYLYKLLMSIFFKLSIYFIGSRTNVGVPNVGVGKRRGP